MFLSEIVNWWSNIVNGFLDGGDFHPPAPVKRRFESGLPAESASKFVRRIRRMPGAATKVRLSPSDAITFAQEGIEISGALTITNTSDGPITFKVKTTSPEKFRVRPYCGALGTGASVNINVLLLSDYKPASIVQDKFLVMILPLDTDNPPSNQINEAWKNSGSLKVEEFRLRCRLNSNLTPTGQPNGAVSPTSSSTDLEQKISQLLVSMNHVNRICSEVETELKTWRRLVVIFIIICVSFGITILYFLSNLPSSDHCHPEPDL